MAYDLEAIKARLAKIKEGGGGNSNLWKPKKGGKESTIRFIDYPHEDVEFVEQWFHYGVGGPGFLCPKRMHGRECPVCDLVSALWDSGTDQDVAQAKRIGAKQRFYGVVIDRADDEPKPKFYGFSKTVCEKLYENLMVANYLDPNEGFDFVVKSVKAEDKLYPDTFVTLIPKPVPVAESKNEIGVLIGSVKPIDEIFKPLTASEIEQRLAKWLDPDGETAEGSSKEVSRGGTKDLGAELDNALAPSKSDELKNKFADSLTD